MASDTSPGKAVAQRKRVVVIDDHQLLRQGLERLLDSTDEFIVCGQAGTAAEGAEVVRKTKPDAVIVDIGLPDMDGISLTRRLATENPDLPIVILSMHDDGVYADQAKEAGAIAYVIKHEAVEKLQKALEDAIAGRPTFP